MTVGWQVLQFNFWSQVYGWRHLKYYFFTARKLILSYYPILSYFYSYQIIVTLLISPTVYVFWFWRQISKSFFWSYYICCNFFKFYFLVNVLFHIFFGECESLTTRSPSLTKSIKAVNSHSFLRFLLINRTLLDYLFIIPPGSLDNSKHITLGISRTFHVCIYSILSHLSRNLWNILCPSGYPGLIYGCCLVFLEFPPITLCGSPYTWSIIFFAVSYCMQCLLCSSIRPVDFVYLIRHLIFPHGFAILLLITSLKTVMI